MTAKATNNKNEGLLAPMFNLTSSSVLGQKGRNFSNILISDHFSSQANCETGKSSGSLVYQNLFQQ